MGDATLQDEYRTRTDDGFEGQLSELKPAYKRGYINGEAESGIPFGRAVVQGEDASQVALPSAAGDLFVGVSVMSHQHAREELEEHGGVPPGNVLDVLRTGTILVFPEQEVAPGDDVYFRFADGDDPAEVPGRFRKDDDDDTGARAAQVQRAAWLGSGGPDTPVLLEVALP